MAKQPEQQPEQQSEATQETESMPLPAGVYTGEQRAAILAARPQKPKK